MVGMKLMFGVEIFTECTADELEPAQMSENLGDNHKQEGVEEKSGDEPQPIPNDPSQGIISRFHGLWNGLNPLEWTLNTITSYQLDPGSFTNGPAACQQLSILYDHCWSLLGNTGVLGPGVSSLQPNPLRTYVIFPRDYTDV